MPLLGAPLSTALWPAAFPGQRGGERPATRRQRDAPAAGVRGLSSAVQAVSSPSFLEALRGFRIFLVQTTLAPTATHHAFG